MKPSGWHRLTLAAAVSFAAFSAVHLIDDFLFDVPRQFHLSVQFTELLALVFMAALVGLIAAAAGRSRTAYLGLAIAGVLITLAQIFKRLPEMLQPGPWHAGLISEFLAVGLGVSATLTAAASSLTWRESRPPS